jgi:hypothetical protein
MPDADELYEYVKQYDHEFLTATGHTRHEAISLEKKGWAAEHYPNVKVNTTVSGKTKIPFAGENKILIDDKVSTIDKWNEVGGIGVLHTDTASTIEKLKELGL